MPKNLKVLTELIEPEKLRQLQHRVSSSSNVVAMILDRYGKPVTELSELSGFCNVRDTTCGKSCEEIHRILFEKARKSHDLELSTCLNSGLSAAALPITHEGEVIFMWILCRFSYLDEEYVHIHKAGHSVPVLNKAGINLLLNFITLLTEDLLHLKFYNLQVNHMQDKVHKLAFEDGLLELPNSLSMEKDLHNNPHYKHLVFLDVEHLRKINDAYGRICGDKLLQAICLYIKSLHIPASGLYRLEVADFGILLEKQTNKYINGLMQTIHDRCLQPWILDLDGNQLDIFISINIGVLPVNDDRDPIYHNLTSAMEYTLDIAHKSGGIALYDDQANRRFLDRIKLELELRNAVRDNMRGFYVVYQPIVDPGVALWKGLEALCRWKSDSFGEISPKDFIPLAETSGMISAIGKWILETSIRQVKAWGLEEISNFILDVNISPIQLIEPEFDHFVMKVLEQYHFPPERLCLEITESNEMSLTKHTIKAIKRLSGMGIIFALDDFGTGYSTLSMLHRLPVKLLKTDRSLINNFESDSFLQRLFYVMAEIAHAAGMKIIAEGVEGSNQAQLLLKQGVDYFQGFCFSAPLSVQEVEEKIDYFYNPSAELVSMGYSKLDLSRLSDEYGGYDLSPVLYKLLNRCMRMLFTNPDGDEAINFALQYIGEALGVSRSYVFLKGSDGLYSNTHEWCAAGIAPEKRNLQKLDIESVSPGWINTLVRDGMLVASDIRSLEESSLDVLKQQGIKAVVEFPVWQEGTLYGFVGFDDCENIHYWTREEVQMLHTLTSIIASTLNKKNLQNQIAVHNRRMGNMLNHMDTIIYVSDLETHEILFANTTLQKLYGNQPLVGRVCWEVLQNRTEMCEFCKIPYLIKHPDESYQWEFYNELFGSHFRIRDSIISWDDDRMVHLEYAINITEIKNYQHRLETYASMDMLTNTLNRNSFLQAARNILDSNHMEAQPASFAFIDIDGLKSENDQFGHGAGDELIKAVVNILVKNIRKTDIIGRYGGDEFVILFSNCTRSNAERSLVKALKQLEEEYHNMNYSFSYGLADNQEIEYDSSWEYMMNLLDIADMRMIKFKKSHRKSRLRSSFP